MGKPKQPRKEKKKRKKGVSKKNPEELGITKTKQEKSRKPKKTPENKEYTGKY